MKQIFFLMLFAPIFSFGQSVVKVQTSSGIALASSAIASMSNTTAETTVFSYQVIPGEFGLSKELNLEMKFALTSLLVTPNVTIKIKYGGQVLTVISGLGINLSQSSGIFSVQAKIANKNSTASQYVYGRVMQSATQGPLALTSPIYEAQADWTVDASIAQTLSVTVQFGSAVSTTSLATKYVKLKID